MKTLRLEVLTPERVVLAEDAVRSVRLKLSDGGWLSIHPRHAPLIAVTLGGEVHYVTEDGEQTRDLPGGILYVTPTQVTIFLES